MPNRSQTSRSSQLAAGQTPLTVATCGVVAVQPHLQPQPQPVLDRHEDVDDLEARLARPEVDRGQLGEKREAQIRRDRAARARPRAARSRDT